MVPMQIAYCLLVLVFLAHGGLIFMVKLLTSKSFKKAPYTSQLRHIVESFNLPDCFLDWSSEGGRTPEIHLKQWRRAMKEVCLQIAIQCITNLVLLTPLLVASIQIQERHLLLQASIGVHPEEQAAFDIVIFLEWMLPLVTILSALFDMGLWAAYMNWLHPWKGILQTEATAAMQLFSRTDLSTANAIW